MVNVQAKGTQINVTAALMSRKPIFFFMAIIYQRMSG